VLIKGPTTGKMLRMAYDMLSPDGYLFLALPLPCVMNSRYLTSEHLKSLMAALGFVEIKDKWKKGGKMAYWLYQKSNENGDPSMARAKARGLGGDFGKKTVIRQGNRNNFCVLL